MSRLLIVLLALSCVESQLCSHEICALVSSAGFLRSLLVDLAVCYQSDLCVDYADVGIGVPIGGCCHDLQVVLQVYVQGPVVGLYPVLMVNRAVCWGLRVVFRQLWRYG